MMGPNHKSSSQKQQAPSQQSYKPSQASDSVANAGRQVVANTVTSISTLASEVENAAAVIQRLEKASENIGSVLDVIRDIAVQTNLLALNAAIEAARACTSLNQITQIVAGITDMNTQIASAAEEQSAVSDEINKNIVTINEMAEHTASGANQAATSGEHIKQLTSDLRGMVSQFKV